MSQYFFCGTIDGGASIVVSVNVWSGIRVKQLSNQSICALKMMATMRVGVIEKLTHTERCIGLIRGFDRGISVPVCLSIDVHRVCLFGLLLLSHYLFPLPVSGKDLLRGLRPFGSTSSVRWVLEWPRDV